MRNGRRRRGLVLTQMAIICIAILLLQTACDSVRSRRTEEYLIYSAVIDLYSFDEAHIMIVMPTIQFDVDEKMQQIKLATPNLPATSEAALADYRAQSSAAPQTFERQFSFSGQYSLLERQPSDPPKSWSQFKNEYPEVNYFVLLSPIGMNSDMSEAIVYGGFSCGRLCGHGDLYLLAKEHGQWTVKSAIPIWIS